MNIYVARAGKSALEQGIMLDIQANLNNNFNVDKYTIESFDDEPNREDYNNYMNADVYLYTVVPKTTPVYKIKYLQEAFDSDKKVILVIPDIEWANREQVSDLIAKSTDVVMTTDLRFYNFQQITGHSFLESVDTDDVPTAC